MIKCGKTWRKITGSLNYERNHRTKNYTAGETALRGKAKKVYAANDDNLVIIHYKDDATAFNGEKKGRIEDKGVLNNKIASGLFELV